MHSKILFLLISAASLVFASPVERRNTPPTGASFFTPSARYHYDVSTGAIDCNVNGGLVSKSTTNNGHDITTLVTFTYPQAAQGKQCQLFFYLDSTATVGGSKKIDVFTSLQPAPGCTTGWGPGNQRNINIGRWSVSKGNFATWDATYGAYLTQPTTCQDPGSVEGLEFVGVYDDDLVRWNPAAGAGARIYYF